MTQSSGEFCRVRSDSLNSSVLVLLFVAGPPLNISVNITVVTFGAIKEINLVWNIC